MHHTHALVSAAACRHCGWPDSEPYEVVSRHATTEGVIVYTRCVCGVLHVRRHSPGAASTAATIIARSQQAAARSNGQR